MALADSNTPKLRETLKLYRDRLAALPAWRWIARGVYATAIKGIVSELAHRTGTAKGSS